MVEANAPQYVPPARTLKWHNHVLYWLFAPYMAIFSTILFFAYKRVFDANYSTFVNSTILAIGLIAWIYFLVCHAGTSICRVYANPLLCRYVSPSGDAPSSRATASAVLLVLACYALFIQCLRRFLVFTIVY